MEWRRAGHGSSQSGPFQHSQVRRWSLRQDPTNGKKQASLDLGDDIPGRENGKCKGSEKRMNLTHQGPERKSLWLGGQEVRGGVDGPRLAILNSMRRRRVAAIWPLLLSLAGPSAMPINPKRSLSPVPAGSWDPPPPRLLLISH